MDKNLNEGPDGWNQPYVSARLFEGRPMVFVNPAVFTDRPSGEVMAEQIAAAVNGLLDAQDDYDTEPSIDGVTVTNE